MNETENSELPCSPFRFPDKGKNGVRGGQAIILAGGLGTRLRSVVSDLPKCMAPVAGKPFLHYVVEYLLKQGVNGFIFSLGYKSESIIDYINSQYPMLTVQYSIEEEPLGTGGAIKLACGMVTGEDVLILNGDTLFTVDIKTLSSFHHKSGSACTLALKPMQDFDRYGVVELNDDASISGFKEKQYYSSGLINGGVYALKVAEFLQEDLPQKFSFEKDYLEAFADKRNMHAIVQYQYFIDIGIPEDYERAQVEFGVGS
jgi:D-glycero-alpha-D-manno-heptose 1-phosphate guanylyltransferase